MHFPVLSFIFRYIVMLCSVIMACSVICCHTQYTTIYSNRELTTVEEEAAGIMLSYDRNAIWQEYVIWQEYCHMTGTVMVLSHDLWHKTCHVTKFKRHRDTPLRLTYIIHISFFPLLSFYLSLLLFPLYYFPVILRVIISLIYIANTAGNI